MAVEWTISKKKFTIFRQTDTDPKISLLAGLHTLSNLFHNKNKKQAILSHQRPFSQQKQKTTYSITTKTFFTVFQISHYFVSITLKASYGHEQ